MIFLEATTGDKKHTIIKILLLEYLSKGWCEQIGSKLFPLSTIIFTIDVPVIMLKEEMLNLLEKNLSNPNGSRTHDLPEPVGRSNH